MSLFGFKCGLQYNLNLRSFNTYVFVLFIFVIHVLSANAQVKVLDEFELIDDWNFIKSDGVEMSISSDDGMSGNAVRFDYDFTNGTGYGGIQKFFDIPLPENYELTFYIKAISPDNNFEIKLLDQSGENVWWVSNRNYNFPTEWTKVKIKKRHLSFAWGPSEGKEPTRFDRIEFTIASFVGGKGTIWIDELKFEPLPPETDTYPDPEITASSSFRKYKPTNLLDNDPKTLWKSKKSKKQSLFIDLKQRREFGGLDIAWDELTFAKSFNIYTSNDAKTWEKLFEINDNLKDRSIISLPEAEARYLRINLLKGMSQKRFGIKDIKFLTLEQTASPNDYFIYRVKQSQPGDFPRYFSEQKSYWTISGVNNDTKEALFNEDCMVEVDKATFSLEPMMALNNKLYNWFNVKSIQYLDTLSSGEYRFLPTVQWQNDNVDLTIQVTSGGEPNKNSFLYVKYLFNNKSTEKKNIDFYVLLRPFQVNPYYQFLNLPGGVGKINKIKEVNSQQVQVDDKLIHSEIPFESVSTYRSDQGNLVDFIRDNTLNSKNTISDPKGLASGIIKYHLTIPSSGIKDFILKIPFHPERSIIENSTVNFNSDFKQSVDFWNDKINHIKFNLPKSADNIINTYKSQLVYILINRDKAGIQPGSRSYERSWIRDGALTSSALLKSGIVTEVKDFINWYSGYLFDNGKVPCVVDFRGPDPVPENDSHGQYIYLIREYFNFTQDTLFLESKNDKILKAVDYIKSLIDERSTKYYKNGNDSIRSLYGLVPESISHEGYSAKPMHSYWDDFFIMKGLKDAVDIQKILGNSVEEYRIAKIRDTFKENLYNSIKLSMKNHGINYIPGCAELGDFDATSTTVALSPCNEMNNLPKPEIYNTFDKYYDHFIKRKDNTEEWVNYTPYENRIIGSFIMLNEPEKAHQLIDYFLKDQRPQGWYHWAEVVWKDYRKPAFIGDMPHTWVGSDFLNSIRSMLVYENEWDQSLVVGAALYQDWIDNPEGMSVEHLPTYYGEISYSIKKDDNKYEFKIWGDLNLPINGIKIQNFNGSKQPKKVLINGKETANFSDKVIQVKQLPADLEIYY